MRTVKIGLCGFTIAVADYSRWFPVVEVQQTFYQPSAESVMRRWRTSTPADMEFTIKAWQLITHTAASPTYRRLKRSLTAAEKLDAGAFRKTKIVDEAWATTLKCASLLDASSVLFQCPASFRSTDENIANMHTFFSRIERPKNLRLMWEPRGPWPTDVVADLCTKLRLVHVVDPFVNRSVTHGVTYFRLHGITGTRHKYSDDELRQLREMIPAEGMTYVLFNNIPRADDARRFGALIGQGLRA